MRFIKWLIGLIIIVGVLLTLAPFAAKWYLTHWFESKGYQAQIKHIGLDFIFGEVSLYDIDVRDTKGEGFSVFSADFDLDLLPLLLERRWVINRASVDSMRLDIRQTDHDWLLAGFSKEAWISKFDKDVVVEIRTVSFINSEICKDYQARCLRVESGSLAHARLDQQASGWSFLHTGPLVMQKAFLRDRSSNATLFYGGELNIERGIYAKHAVDITGVRLQNIQFIENDLDEGVADAPYQTQIGELLLSSLQWQRTEDAVKLKLGPIKATSVRQAVQKNRQGELLLPPRMQRWVKNVHQTLERDDISFTLTELSARDGAVAWADYSVTPPAMEKVSSLQLYIGAVDTALANTPTPFQLSGKLGRVGLLKFEGQLFPFLDSAKFQFSGVIESLDVSKLSGYTLALLDQRVAQGMVDVAIDATAENGHIDAQTRWQWTDFVIEPSPKKSTYMPLELAYDLLKDHNNSIRFTIETSGDFGSKTIQPQYIFATQTRRTLSNLARAQVEGSGRVSVAPSSARNQQIAFEPLYYSTDARYPGEEAQPRIEEMAKILVDKPHLKMNFCAVSTGGEWAELYEDSQPPRSSAQITSDQRQHLLDLAAARGRALHAALLDAGVASNQIKLCSPRVDMNLTGSSFIAISL